MAQGIPILKDAPYNVLTVPNYVRNLVVTTKPAQVIAAYTAPPGVEAWTVYRPSAEGVPAHPYDGWRVVTPISEGAETTVAVTLTEHIVNDTEYVVRVFIRGKLGFQTRVGGAVARATPVAGQRLGDMQDGTNPAIISFKENGVNVTFLVLKHNYESSGGTLVLRQNIYDLRQWDTATVYKYEGSLIDQFANGGYLELLDAGVQSYLVEADVPTSSDGASTIKIIRRKGLILSAAEVWPGKFNNFTSIEGSPLEYFNSNVRRIRTYNGAATEYYLRTYRLGMNYAAATILASGDYVSASKNTSQHGFLPAVVLSSDMLFSPEPNPDGSYSPIL